MGRHSATNSCVRQQLIRAGSAYKLQPMVAKSKNDFAARLKQACDEADEPFPVERGRREELRRRLAKRGLKLSGESVRKWLSGESIPSMDNVRVLASVLGVSTEWLLSGRGEKKIAAQTSVYQTQQTSAAYPVEHDSITEEIISLLLQLDKDQRLQVLGLAKGLLSLSSARPRPDFIEATGT